MGFDLFRRLKNRSHPRPRSQTQRSPTFQDEATNNSEGSKPSHGGDYDASEYHSNPGGHTEDTTSFEKGPSHGGAFHLDQASEGPSYVPSHPGTQTSDTVMSSNKENDPAAPGSISNAMPLQTFSGVQRRPLPAGQAIHPSASSSAEQPLIEHRNAAYGAKADEEAGRGPVDNPLLFSPKWKLMCSKLKIFHHRDILKRDFKGPKDDRFLNPKHGRPSKLHVQSSENVLASRSPASWTRVTVRRKGPLILRLSAWAMRENSVSRWVPASLALSVMTINVAEWRKINGTSIALEYVVVSYTGQHYRTHDDYKMLHAIGKHAADKAGVRAYWVGCSCLGPEKEQEENVWQISDVIRGAFSVVIAVAGPIGRKVKGRLPDDLLRDWGNRVWVLPELLLSPEHDDVRVYTINRNLDPRVQLQECLNTPPDQIHRRNFSRFWEDDQVVGQLLDHYEGSVILSPLELMTTALRCLGTRHTTQYLPGDLSYALMGLLRQRPNARITDSAFQAFARLSLANDSNLLLERLICLLPESPYAPWHSLQDHWDATLWDIYPRSQVCGIGKHDTVILDGARAANIRWKSFKNVILRGNDTWKRKFARFTLIFILPLLITAISLLASGSILPSKTLRAIGGLLLAIVLCIIFASPALVNSLYNGKVWSAQPWFFGIEGYMSLSTIERNLFGAEMGRLSWSTTSSSLSRHDYLKSDFYDDYCEGQDPSRYQDIQSRIQNALKGRGGDEKIFTLVDTYTMTVTLFAAVKPPVAVLCCGEEGGMQRALLCSYDWTSNTLFRETVLRMETRAYWRMSPVARVRLSLQTRGKVEGDLG
ncbi:MAG: hypothetical protein Q9218_004403 [Villophora microphyllina]